MFDPGRLDALLAARTPTVACDDPESGCTIWLKLEYQLPSGSTKDRMASHVLALAVADGRVHPGTTVVEASSGSTSIAFAMACAALGVRFVAVMPEGVSNERLLIIRRYGGDWLLVPAEGGMEGAIAETERMAAADPDVFLPRQFTNPDNAAAHELRTGPSCWRPWPGRARRSTGSWPRWAPRAASWAWAGRSAAPTPAPSSPGCW